MDESQVNPLEYEEVAFQDLIEENDNYGEREDESQFKGIESSSLNLHLSNQ